MRDCKFKLLKDPPPQSERTETVSEPSVFTASCRSSDLRSVIESELEHERLLQEKLDKKREGNVHISIEEGKSEEGKHEEGKLEEMTPSSAAAESARGPILQRKSSRISLSEAMQKDGDKGDEPCDCTATALIVDDNPFNLIPLEVLLQGLGITAISAHGGQEAIDKFVLNRIKRCCSV